VIRGLSISSLCAFAPLREASLICLLFTVTSARADDELVRPVSANTLSRLEQIDRRVDGVLGIVIEDLKGEHRFAVNADKTFSQASAIKIPILMEVFKQADEGKVDLDERLWVEKKYQVAGSGILGELGDRSTQMSVRDLCVMMIMLSDNTATNMLIDKVGLENVTKSMASLGCEKTRLRRRMMDTEASARGDENVSTPAEAAKLLRLLYNGKFVSSEVSDDILGILRKEKAGDVKSALPEGVKVAFKVGSIPGVATEWAIVELENRPYIVVVMGGYGKGDEFQGAIRRVSEVAYDFFSRLATATKYGAYIDPEEWKKH
jgi:beta-lactamase class A